ncbi:unnamed protein product [Bursaphelenchus okinawaensis]|uniref:Uncharacterized protein n=1 Tax=Bursaphelenchus okinawaensis TaxID=465554 RepID=A0A811JX20_9BILA|nr:unnamed protein product [Bursaphelenchus okinawaensis]CAG9086372.1 unnamed protein product [Bursaphelenchus okinawaensis]
MFNEVQSDETELIIAEINAMSQLELIDGTAYSKVFVDYQMSSLQDKNLFKESLFQVFLDMLHDPNVVKYVLMCHYNIVYTFLAKYAIENGTDGGNEGGEDGENNEGYKDDADRHIDFNDKDIDLNDQKKDFERKDQTSSSSTRDDAILHNTDENDYDTPCSTKKHTHDHDDDKRDHYLNFSTQSVTNVHDTDKGDHDAPCSNKSQGEDHDAYMNVENEEKDRNLDFSTKNDANKEDTGENNHDTPCSTKNDTNQHDDDKKDYNLKFSTQSDTSLHGIDEDDYSTPCSRESPAKDRDVYYDIEDDRRVHALSSSTITNAIKHDADEKHYNLDNSTHSDAYVHDDKYDSNSNPQNEGNHQDVYCNVVIPLIVRLKLSTEISVDFDEIFEKNIVIITQQTFMNSMKPAILLDSLNLIKNGIKSSNCYLNRWMEVINEAFFAKTNQILMYSNNEPLLECTIMVVKQIEQGFMTPEDGIFLIENVKQTIQSRDDVLVDTLMKLLLDNNMNEDLQL